MNLTVTLADGMSIAQIQCTGTIEYFLFIYGSFRKSRIRNQRLDR